MPFTFYHCLSARSFRPLWVLEELGLKYTLRLLPFPPRVHDKRYFDHNPLGTVPLLIDGEGPDALRMSESAVIIQYLPHAKAPARWTWEWPRRSTGST